MNVNVKKVSNLDNQQRINLYTYQGYYNGHFLRSSWEYAFSKYLEQQKISYKVEELSYITSLGKYTPDFFIYNKNKLKVIIEIKPSKLVTSKTFTKITETTKQTSIKTILLTEIGLSKRLRKIGLSLPTLTKEWKVLATDKICHGTTNPIFGKKQTEFTKKLISERAKLRYKLNPNVLNGLAQQNKVEKIKLTCDVCKKEFYVLPCRLSCKKGKYKRHYCSRVCSNLKNKERSNIATKKLKTVKVNYNLQKDFFLIVELINFSAIKFNKLYPSFWVYFNELFTRYDFKDQRTFIYRVTGKHNIDSKTFVNSLRGHRNGSRPFWMKNNKVE